MILIASALAAPCTQADVLRDQLELALQDGQHDQASILAHRALAQANCPAVQASAHGAVGRLASSREAGLAALDRCIAGFSALGSAPEEAACWIDRARLSGPGDDAGEAFARAEALGADPLSLGWARGELTWATGARDQALSLFAVAIAAAPDDRAAPYRYELAWRTRSIPEATPDTIYEALSLPGNSTPPDRAQLQAALEPNEGLLVFLLAPRREGHRVPSWVALITRTRITTGRLPDASELTTSVQQLNTLIQADDPAYEAEATQLFQALFSDLPDLPAQITLMPDGGLRQLPFSALLARDGKPLGVSRAMATTPDLETWFDLRTGTPSADLEHLWDGQDVLTHRYQEAVADGASHGAALQHAIHTAIDAGSSVQDWSRTRLVGDVGLKAPERSSGWGFRILALLGAAIFVLLGGLAWTKRS